MINLSDLDYPKKDIEGKILDLLSNNLMSVTQISKKFGLRKDVGSAILESLKGQGKLELFVVGKSKVYTIPKVISNDPAPKKFDKKIRTIGIISGKGGVGKTITTLNLAGALMGFKKDVIAVDADIKMAGLGLHLGMHNFSKTLGHVMKNNQNILEALHIHSTGLRIIPAPLSTESVDLSNLYPNLQNFLNDNSIVLIDSPPGLEENSIQVLKSCKEAIIVTIPEFQSLTNSIKMIEKAKEMGVNPIGIVVNRYNNSKFHKEMLKEIENICELPILGIIPEDRLIQESTFKKTPNIFLNPYSRSSIIFRQIAAKISGEAYKPPKLPFFMNILRRMA